MCLPVGRRFYTAPCGLRTKWASGRRTPLHELNLLVVCLNNHFSIADVIDKDEETRKIRQLIIDGISQECFQIDACFMIGYHALIALSDMID